MFEDLPNFYPSPGPNPNKLNPNCIFMQVGTCKAQGWPAQVECIIGSPFTAPIKGSPFFFLKTITGSTFTNSYLMTFNDDPSWSKKYQVYQESRQFPSIGHYLMNISLVQISIFKNQLKKKFIFLINTNHKPKVKEGFQLPWEKSLV